MAQAANTVKMKGKEFALSGKPVEVGQKSADFEVLDEKLEPVKLSDLAGRICVITSVPSLDTPVCDVMTHRFNAEAAKLGDDVAVLTISMDLPFAQKRWCGNAGVQNIRVVSDYKLASFGEAFGVLIKELRLLARAVFVLDKDGVVRYVQIVPEITEEPDYEQAIEAVKELKN